MEFAQVDTKVMNGKGEKLALNYRIANAGGQWKIVDVVIENISLVNNYRSHFSRVIAKSSYDGLVQSMKQKRLNAPGTKG